MNEVILKEILDLIGGKVTLGDGSIVYGAANDIISRARDILANAEDRLWNEAQIVVNRDCVGGGWYTHTASTIADFYPTHEEATLAACREYLKPKPRYVAERDDDLGTWRVRQVSTGFVLSRYYIVHAQARAEADAERLNKETEQ